MLGKDFYKIEVNSELSNERLKSLVFFYAPLIGHDALILYEHLVLKGSTNRFEELNYLLSSLNISIDSFEAQCTKLNEYKLLKTLNQSNKYIFIFNSPLTRNEFINDGILQRAFILKTSGVHYQELISELSQKDEYEGWTNITQELPLGALNNWNANDESYLKLNKNNNKYDFNTLFDINIFLKDISTNLLPMRFRTEKNLKEIARLADLYNVSYDKMRTFIPRVCGDDSDEFDIGLLSYLCMNGQNEYVKVQEGNYNVPCLTFLMSLQNGKEVTDYDKKIIGKLSSKYHLNPSVINVLLEHTLAVCDNRLLENYMYPIASDLHRNDVTDAKTALSRLQKPYNKNGKPSDVLPTYSTDSNEIMSQELEDELLRSMGKK